MALCSRTRSHVAVEPTALSSVENAELETDKRRFHKEMYFLPTINNREDTRGRRTDGRRPLRLRRGAKGAAGLVDGPAAAPSTVAGALCPAAPAGRSRDALAERARRGTELVAARTAPPLPAMYSSSGRQRCGGEAAASAIAGPRFSALPGLGGRATAENPAVSPARPGIGALTLTTSACVRPHMRVVMCRRRVHAGAGAAAPNFPTAIAGAGGGRRVHAVLEGS